MSDQSEQLVNDIAGSIADAPKLHELNSDETVTLEIGYFKRPPADSEGVTISFHFGQGNALDQITDLVEPRLDKRKFRVSTDQPRYKQAKSWDIGWVEVDKEGLVVDYHIEDEYLKPSEQDD